MVSEVKEQEQYEVQIFPLFSLRKINFSSNPPTFPFLINFLSVTCTYIYHTCNESPTFTDGSIYSRNLNLVINDLFQNAPQSSGFNTSSHGQSPNKVYGLVQCTGNITAASCSNCVREANNTIKERCPNDIGGKIWLDDCFLRYGSTNFFSILDTDGDSVSKGRSSAATLTLSSPQSEPFCRICSTKLTSLQTRVSLLDLRTILLQESFMVWFSVGGTYQYKIAENALLKQGHSWSILQSKGLRLGMAAAWARYEVYSFYSSAQSPSHSPEEINPLPPTSKKKPSKTLPIVLGFAGGSILVLFICLIVWRKVVKSALFGKAITTPTTNQERRELSPLSELLMHEHKFVFRLQALVEATENFNDHNKLGQGGFGAVYKGLTRDGNLIAVKKLYAKSTQGKTEFMNEVKLVANVQHRNLARLLGCCMEENERLLVYEYYPNKSLDNFLFAEEVTNVLRIGITDPEKCRELDWQKRYIIIVGIVRGLLYLHEDSPVRIIHRDIKANNILLDHKLNPKIADFGLARFFSEDETHIHTRVAGTCGYMAPEYVMRGQLSVKADVYSFGVLLLEIVTGKKSTDILLQYQMESLVDWAWKQFMGGSGLGLVDSMASEINEEQALRCIHVGLLCVQSDANLRPAMSNVVMMLSRGNAKLPNPSRPAFVNSSKIHASKSKSRLQLEECEKRIALQTSGAASSSSSGIIRSVNEASVTEIEAR